MSALNSKNFEEFSKKIMNELKGDEELSLSMTGEETHFSRLSKARVRQATHLHQAFLEFKFIKKNKALTFVLPYRNSSEDLEIAVNKLNESRKWIATLPDDPYLVRPQFYGVSHSELESDLPGEEEMLEAILQHSSAHDLAGIFSSGEIVRASLNNKGQFHWFKTKNFYLDYSLYNSNQKAVKSLYAGSHWSAMDLAKNINESAHKLSMMNKVVKKIERGSYRVYLAPSAVSELLGTLSWEGLSMGAHKKGSGGLKDLWEKKKKLSPKFSLSENFKLGLSPRFNELGEVSDEVLPLITKGEFTQFLTSTRTANEYEIKGNRANEYESLRSPVVDKGNLSRENILSALGTGLYISDLHYLNWSDRETARVTGMTRYACFWVEKGEIVCPIQDLRFDESFYSLFGSELIDLTDFQEISPNTGSYFEREVGGSKTPGILLGSFKFTL